MVCKMVMNHLSFRSSSDLSKLFQAMFPDSEIAKEFSMGYDKARYLLCFGIAPYFESQLDENLQNCKSYSISFDESLNKDLQKNQMDIHVRFWDHQKDAVATRYLTSEFLGHGSASDLKEKN